MENGGAKEIPFAPETCSGAKFENAIREFGVVAACEWFGYPSDSEFTRESIRVLVERTKGD